VKPSGILLILMILSLSACAETAAQLIPVRVEPAEVAQPTPVTPAAQNELSPAATVAESIEPEAAPPTAVENERPLAARVNDARIYLETYEKQVAQMTQALQAQDVDLTGESGQDTLTQVRRQVLEALIDQQIIEQQAAQLGITISDETVEAEAQENIGQDTAQFAEWLAANNLSYEEFKSTLRSQLIAGKLFEYITRDIPETAEQIRLRHIQVADEATARTLIEQLKTGADFATLAQAQSLDENSRANGGDLGWFPRGLGPIPAEVEAAAFSLQPGQISGPIQAALGFHIIKLEEREANRPLNQEMQQALRQKFFTDWLMKQRASASIERFVEL
jgi:foldase protein PrsA